MALFLRLLILLILPLISDCKIKGRAFYPLAGGMFWSLVVVFFMITLIGIAPVEAPFTFIGLAATFFYFLLFCLLAKVSSLFEKLLL